ncbi:hemolysin activation/secretion protein [Azospirillum fermentarium]|uniref:ShlB/FhaC/HecB family hemolysin secretion/activation protein n=1 Tax=Azospirillum fermentarium TaxID=1233114 RepID=UPI002226DE49|nr:ShlB/FhaC/HecB family hemolysin secretion/activation protein [Azospirillum fermentarium]MCW2249409.1 hemolysin activation/secretion protein [Azospirillum fermentarium]
MIRAFSPKPASAASVLALTLALAAAPAAAQDWERVAPKQPPANPPAAAPALPPPAPALPPGDQVITPALKGLLFVPDGAAVKHGGIDARGVAAAGLDLPDEPAFRALLEPYLGKPLTFDGLNAISRATVLWFREHDRPLVDVVVPEQDVTNGSLQIIVVAFRVGSVTAEGNRWFSDGLLLSQVRARPGGLISGSAMLEDVEWLNRNPFRHTDLVYQRGTEPGTSDIVLRTADRFPVRVFGGYENTGTAATGRDRLFAGINWGNAFWADQQISYQISVSPDALDPSLRGANGGARSLTHAASWQIPLPWRHTLTLFGSHTTTRPDLGADFAQVGRSAQLSARYAVPLPTLAFGAGTLRQGVQVGADWKRSNNNLDFGGTSVFRSSTDIAQAVVAYDASLADAWGATGISASLFHSPGGMGAHNRDAVFATSRTGAPARYTYARIGADRVTRLPEDFSWLVRAQAQVSSANLLSSEQLSLGGNASVRGYAESEVLGDRGVLLSTELRTPEVGLARLFGGRGLEDTLQGLVFVDYGVAGPRHPMAGENRRTVVTSVGPGLRYSLPPYLTLKLDWGFQLRGTNSGEDRFGRPHIALSVAY